MNIIEKIGLIFIMVSIGMIIDDVGATWIVVLVFSVSLLCFLLGGELIRK